MLWDIITSDLTWNLISLGAGALGFGGLGLVKVRAAKKVVKEAIELFDALPVHNAEIEKVAQERPAKFAKIARELEGGLDFKRRSNTPEN